MTDRRLSAGVFARRFTLLVGLAAATPVMVAIGYAVAQDWAAIGDDAYITTRAFDVLTDRTPLVGQRSSGASGVLTDTAYSPGPLLFWLFAIPVRLGGQSLPAIVAGLVNVASIVGMVALARRRGGPPFMLVAAVAIPVMLLSLPGEVYSDVWNSSSPLLPLGLLVFLSWSVACGEWRSLPLAVLVASFTSHSHLTFVAPSIGLLGAAVVCAVATRRNADDRDVGHPRRWIAASLIVGLICWSAPIVDQATNRPGNLVKLTRSAAAGEPTLGLDAGWRALAQSIGGRPWWLDRPQTVMDRAGDVTVPPSRAAAVMAVLIVVALAFVTVQGWRRRRRDIVAAGVLGLTLCAAIASATSATPINAVFTLNYVLRWTCPAGMAIWLLLGFSFTAIAAANSASPANQALRRIAARAASATPYARFVSIAVVAAVGVTVAVARNPPRHEPYQPMRAILDRLGTALPADRSTLVVSRGAGSGFALAYELQVGVVYWLRRSGRAVVTPPQVTDRLDPAYGKGQYEQVLRVAVDQPPQPGSRQLLRVVAHDPLVAGDADLTVTVTLQRANGSR